MLGLLLLAFIAVPIAEIYVITQVADGLGWWPTLALVLVVSVVGAWLVKYEGLGVLGRVERRLSRGEVPGREIVDGVLILVGGALLLTPGFITDGVGVALLLPPVRALLRGSLARRYQHRLTTGRVGGNGPVGRWVRFGDVVDVEEVDPDDGHPHRPGPGRLAP